MSRRPEILDAARRAFAARGYEGTSISELAQELGVSKAAISYHFSAKESLLHEVADPFLEQLEAVVRAHPDPVWPAGAWALASDYFEVLVAHREVAVWLDSDRSVQERDSFGGRLRRTNATFRHALAGSDDPADDARSLSALGGLWRPLRNLSTSQLAAHRDDIIRAALVSIAPIEKPS